MQEFLTGLISAVLPPSLYAWDTRGEQAGVEIVDFGLLASILWPVTVAIPGFVAFFWNWADRKERTERLKPYIVAQGAERFGFKPKDGLTPLDFTVRNNLDMPISIKRIEVLKPRGCVIGYPSLPASRQLKTNWEVPAHSQRPGGLSPWVVFVGLERASYTDEVCSNVQIVMRCTFEEMSATARTSFVNVTSKPITLTAARQETIK